MINGRSNVRFRELHRECMASLSVVMHIEIQDRVLMSANKIGMFLRFLMRGKREERVAFEAGYSPKKTWQRDWIYRHV